MRSITSLNFIVNFLIIGTTLGKLTLYNLILHKILILFEYSKKKNRTIHFNLGDEKIVIYVFTSNNKNNLINENKPLIKEIEIIMIIMNI